MIKRLYARSPLAIKMTFTSVFAMLAALLVYFSIYAAGSFLIENIYMSSSRVSQRKGEVYTEFANYIRTNNISAADSAAIARWTEDKEYVSIYVFRGTELRFRASEGRSESPKDIATPSTSQYSSLYGTLYPVRFEDGVHRIAISDSSQNREYTLTRFISLAFAAVVFILVLFMYIQHLTMRIARLSKDAEQIGNGHMDYPLTIDGEDELGKMASEFDRMRNSVIEKMADEKRAWQANSDLLTAISHDVRTPMTSLLGYLDLLKDSSCSPEDRETFTDAAYTKALKLKELTDELFRYFLVFGKADVKLELEVFDADILFDQLLSEAQLEIESSGYSITREAEVTGACISADVMYLKRVMDNLVSNIKKYADREIPVVFRLYRKDRLFCVCAENGISPLVSHPESNKIGLKTCGKVMELMGGFMEIRKTDTRFSAEIVFPVRSED